MTACVFALLLAASPQINAQDPVRSFAVTDDSAYLMLLPTFICNGEARKFTWSQDGSRLAVERSVVDFRASDVVAAMTGQAVDPAKLDARSEVYVWNQETNSSKLLWTIRGPSKIESVDWMYGNGFLIATVRDPDNSHQVLAISASSQATTKLLTSQQSDFVEVLASPKMPVAVVFESNGSSASIQIFRDGHLSDKIQTPEPQDRFIWGVSGELYCAMRQAGRAVLHQFDFASGKFFGVTKDQLHLGPPDPNPVLGVEGSTGPGGGLNEPSPTSQTVWLRPYLYEKYDFQSGTESNKPSKHSSDIQAGLVTSDGSDGSLSPNLGAVAYSHQGTAMVRKIVQVPKAAFFRARDAAARSLAINKSKQVGLALIILAADNDDVLPGKDGWQDKVLPYIKDRAMIDGFNYTFGGGPETGIDKPAETMLGFVNGPGGRAVVYADGHVQWVAN